MVFFRLQDLVAKAAADRNLGSRLVTAHVFQVYRNFIFDRFGEDFLFMTKPRSLKNKTLWVAASDSVVANEILLRSQDFLEYLASRVPKSRVEQLRISQENVTEKSYE